MKIKHLSGLIAAPFTPMNNDGSLNLSIIPEYYQFLKSNGVTGGFICGSTGEGVSMTSKEKMAVAEAWTDCTKNDDDFKVMTLLGGTCIAECKELALHAQSIGIYGISFTAPFYFKTNSAEVLAQCCIEIGNTVPNMPFYYYHVPVLTGVNIAMIDLLKALDGKLPNFAGVKYTHEDFMDYLSCLQFKDGKYDMLWGRDENMLAALALGAKGAVGSTFNYAAPLYHDMINAYNNGHLNDARIIQQQSIDMIRLLSKYGGISTGKAFMKLAGINCGGFRLPVKNMSEEQFVSFSKDVEAVDFYNFKSSIAEPVG